MLNGQGAPRSGGAPLDLRLTLASICHPMAIVELQKLDWPHSLAKNSAILSLTTLAWVAFGPCGPPSIEKK